jgi:branched-subunit amino acid transport protein
MNTWIAIVAVGIGSYLVRVTPVLALAHVALSPRAERVLRHAGTAAIAGLIATSLSGYERTHGIAGLVAAVAGLSVAAALAHRRRPLLATVACGFVAYAAAALFARLVTA